MNIIMGPLGSGKTICSAHIIRDCMMDIPPDNTGVRRSSWVSVRNTFNDLKRTTIADWHKVVDPSWGKWNASDLVHYVEMTGEDDIPIKAEMHFIAFDLPGSLKKWRGQQRTGVWFNELKELPEAIMTFGLSRTGRDPRKQSMPIDPATGKPTRYWFGGIGDSNAWDDDHWLCKYQDDVESGKAPDYAFFVQPGGVIRVGTSDEFIINPEAENMVNLDEDYYKRQMQGASADFIAVNLGNEIGDTSTGKPVHPEYSDRVHSPEGVKIDYIEGLPVFMGVDFGRTPSATLFQEVAGGYQVFDEYVMTDAAITTFAKLVKLYLAREYNVRVGTDRVTAYCDPSGVNKTESSETSAIGLLTAAGFDAMEAPVANTDETARRKALTDPLTEIRIDGKPRMMIARRAKTLRTALKRKWQYRRLQVSYDERYTEVPDKSHPYSDIGEACEYGLIGRGEGVIYSGNPSATVKRAPSLVTRV